VKVVVIASPRTPTVTVTKQGAKKREPTPESDGEFECVAPTRRVQPPRPTNNATRDEKAIPTIAISE
jgi:hypothetical protein